jgi:FlaG/FlaF family flagellin (archaellin)
LSGADTPDSMGIVEDLKNLNPVVQILLGIVVVGVVLVVAAVVLVVLAAIIGTFVLGVGGEVEAGPQAGAAITPDEAAGTAEVVWTSNQDADHLVVEWSTSGGTVGASGLEGAELVGENSARIDDVGGSVTLAEDDADTDTTISFIVSAVNEDGESVILDKEVTV